MEGWLNFKALTDKRVSSTLFMFASLVTRTPRQTELTAISRSTPDTTVTATPTVTDREHDGWGGGGWWVGIKAG